MLTAFSKSWASTHHAYWGAIGDLTPNTMTQTECKGDLLQQSAYPQMKGFWPALTSSLIEQVIAH